VGLIAALVGIVAGWLGLPPAISAGLALASMVIITGALHEDGLADSADGLWGGWDPVRRLEIMKDSHIGSYGVIALILSLGLRWVALTSLAGQGGPLNQTALISALVLCATLSRAPMVVVMSALPHARRGGLSVRVGRPHRASAALAVAVALAVGLVFLGLALAGLIVVLGLVTLAIILISKVKIGGQTGDILGATQQISEIAILCVLVSLAG
jgi:adenosylcobinamide-GDP ribazoletransferase